MSELLGSFVFRLSTDNFDTPTNAIQWTADGPTHIDVSFEFRPEVSATIDETSKGLEIRVKSSKVPGKNYLFTVGTNPSHDEIVNAVGLIFTAVLGLHREAKAQSHQWLEHVTESEKS